MDVKKLEDVAEIFSGVQISRFKDKNSQEQPVIKNKFIKEDILDYSLENITKEINDKYYSQKGDIIISLSKPNTVSILKENGYIIPMYFAIIRLKKGYDSSFIYHLLNSEIFHKNSYRFLEGGALKVIKISDLKNMKVTIPNIDKQKKYGELLNLIDEKNNLLEKKKNCNKKIKEYLIQTQLKGEK